MPGKTVVVVPCYDEAEWLDTEAFRANRHAEPHVHFLFVNDGSSDQTGEVIERLASDFGVGAGALHLERSTGKAEAVRCGVLSALAESPAAVSFWDADLATPLRAIAAFQRVLHRHEHIEMVVGARVALLGRDIRRRAKRHYRGRVFATAVSSASSLPVLDKQCGAKLFCVTPLSEIFADHCLSRWSFDVKIIARRIRAARGTGASPAADVIYEFPLENWIDVPGSRLRAMGFPRAFWDLLRLRSAYLA